MFTELCISNQSKQILKSFEQYGLNRLCKNTDLRMKRMKSLIKNSMSKALSNQHEAVTLSNGTIYFQIIFLIVKVMNQMYRKISITL